MALAVLGVFALFPLATRADLVYEPFDYAEGSDLDGLVATGVNLTGSYSTSTIQDLVIASPGLTYGNLRGNVPSAGGNRLSDESGAGAGISSVAVDQDVLSGAGTTLYFSALFTFDDTNNRTRRAAVFLVDDDTGDEIGFGESVAGTRAITVSAFTQATGELETAGADLAFENGQTLWLVGRYINSSAAGGDVLELLGYDTAEAITIGPSFDFADSNAQFAFALSGLDIDFEKISSLRLEVRGQNNNFLDEVRISRTFGAGAAVIPEPSGVMLMVLGLLSGGALGRRAVIAR
jgi:hypothetical protein